MSKKPEVEKLKRAYQVEEQPQKDFRLDNQYWEQLSEFDVYTSEKKTTRIFGVRNKKPSAIDPDLTPYIKARTRSKTPSGWKFIHGIDLHVSSHVTRFIQGVLSIANRLGWKIKIGEDIEKLKTNLRESEQTIIELEKTNNDWRKKHEELMDAFRKKQEQILTSRVKEFETNIEELQKLITSIGTIKTTEQDLQLFLYTHPWLFGTEYVNAEPQKLRGAHSKFDFYLERFNKTNDIVEIKLPSDNIINRDGSLSAKISQALDQLIEYMESSQAAAHSKVISEEESIHELRPRGLVIIGCDSGSDAKKKIQKWNYQFAHITILTYWDVLERAKIILQHLKTEKNN